jgi:hypothetical protein
MLWVLGIMLEARKLKLRALAIRLKNCRVTLRVLGVVLTTFLLGVAYCGIMLIFLHWACWPI